MCPFLLLEIARSSGDAPLYRLAHRSLLRIVFGTGVVGRNLDRSSSVYSSVCGFRVFSSSLLLVAVRSTHDLERTPISVSPSARWLPPFWCVWAFWCLLWASRRWNASSFHRPLRWRSCRTVVQCWMCLLCLLFHS